MLPGKVHRNLIMYRIGIGSTANLLHEFSHGVTLLLDICTRTFTVLKGSGEGLDSHDAKDRSQGQGQDQGLGLQVQGQDQEFFVCP
jgi:hypothetical protein